MARMKEMTDWLVDKLNEANLGKPVYKGPRSPIETSGAIFVVPVSDREDPYAIGDNFEEQWELLIEVEIPYDDSEENIDELFDLVDAIKDELRELATRSISALNAREGRYGSVEYLLWSWKEKIYRAARIPVNWIGEQ